MEQKDKEKFISIEEFEALQKAFFKLQQEHESLKQKSSSSYIGNRHSKQFWDDIENKLKNDTDGVKNLIKDKVILMDDVNDNGWTLLQFAAYIGNYSITQLCINLGAKLNHKNADNNTALQEAQEAMMTHTEQLLLFSQMEASIGDRIKNVSFEINKQKGIIENIETGLTLIGTSAQELFMKTCVELMVNIIGKKQIFSDDLLNLCWKYETAKYHGDIEKSELYQCLLKTCRGVISGKDKRDWYWFLRCMIMSNIWYTICDQIEQVPCDDDPNKMKNVKKRQYLYYVLLKTVTEEAKTQTKKLETNLAAEAKENESGWDKLVTFAVAEGDLVQFEGKTPRQDIIPNGIVGEYTYDQLNYDASNDMFDGAKFYDHHQYLSKVSILAQIVDDPFHKSIKKMYNIDSFTNIGIVEEAKQDIFIYYSRGPVKLLERARAKAENDYFDQQYPTSACVIDMNRCSLVFTNINSLLFGLRLFINKVRAYQSGTVIGIVRCKNGFIKYVKKGARYADIKFNVLIKGPTNNIVGEIQFSLKTMMDFKSRAHNLYEIMREQSFIENSVSKILPSLINCKKQLKVYATMGDVFGLCSLMVYNNMHKKDLLNHESVDDVCILSPICESGKKGAFKFVISLMKPDEIIEELFMEDEFDITPIEYAVRNNHLAVIQEILSRQEVLNKYKTEQKWRYRLIFHVFAMCCYPHIIDTVLTTVDSNDKEIQFLFTEFECEDEDFTESFYAEDSIIVEMCTSNNMAVLEKLKGILGLDIFIQNVFVIDAKDQNAFEAVCAEDKWQHMKYLLLFEKIKNEYISNMLGKEEQNKIIFRMLYLLFARNKNMQHIEFVLKELNITNEIITSLLEYKYGQPSEEEELDEDAYRYHEWIINEDEEIKRYLALSSNCPI